MALSKQVLCICLGAFLLVVMMIGYLGFSDVIVLGVSSERNYHRARFRPKPSPAKQSKLMVRGHKDEHVIPSPDTTKNQTLDSDASAFVQKTFLRHNIPDVRKKTDTPLDNGTFPESTPENIPQRPGEHSVDSTTVAKRGPARSCKAQTHVVFFKMHKCSSSTIQNILFRFGEERSLNFVLPSAGNYLGHAAFSKRYMIRFPVKEYNILCHHTIFNEAGMAEVMPANSVYITILRNPVPMFESLFSYNNMARVYNLPSSRGIELFLKRPDYYYRRSDGGILHMKNPMLHGLGLPKSLLGDISAIDGKIAQAKKRFDLVMMTEYFEESLILLRDLLCWETDDIVYLVHNARSKSQVQALSPQVSDKIRKWNYGDMKLYIAFNRTFWEKVEAYGRDRMTEEVAKLRERNQYFKQRCIAKVTNTNSKVWHPPGVAVDSFLVKPEASQDVTCVRMAEPELLYSEHLRQLQKKRFKMT